jgi:hypothetical protein
MGICITPGRKVEFYVFAFPFYSFVFQYPLRPEGSGRALHDRRRVGESQNMHARAKRKRTLAAVVTGKTKDTLACHRGDVNGDAEK